MIYLDSTAIRGVDYDAQALTLWILFTSGSKYAYFDVPAWKYRALLSAASAGQYFNDNIRDQHASRG